MRTNTLVTAVTLVMAVGCFVLAATSDSTFLRVVAVEPAASEVAASGGSDAEVEVAGKIAERSTTKRPVVVGDLARTGPDRVGTLVGVGVGLVGVGLMILGRRRAGI